MEAQDYRARGLDAMPYKITKADGAYKVTSPHGTRAKHTTKAKAKKQVRLLNAVKHGWRPTGKK